MLYLVTYDLNKPGQKYAKLYETIKALGSWWHNLDSTWLVDSDLTAAQIRDRVRAVVDATDHLLVVRFSADWASFLPTKANSWIESHVGLTV